MRKHSKRILVLLLSVLMLLPLVSCSANDPAITEGEDLPEVPEYTYNDYLKSAPNTWNPHTWKSESDKYVMDLLCTGLYSFKLNSEANGYDIVPEMAIADPVDVTGEYSGNLLYNVPTDATEGYAYKIQLNNKACWEDGTAINADTYLNSMKQLLNSSMKNERASTYTNGNLPIANAESYYNNDKAELPVYVPVYDGNIYADIPMEEMYASLTAPMDFFGGYSAKEYYEAGYVSYFYAEDGTDLFKKYADETYFKLTEEIVSDLKVIAENFEAGAGESEKYKQFCYYISQESSDKTDWEDVGLIKTGEYEIVIILNRKIDVSTLKYRLTSPWIVNDSLYTANKYDDGGIVKTSYATSASTTSSYGPYKLTRIASDGTLSFIQNENWYGYADGNHDGMYQTTAINCMIINDDSIAMNLFEKGRLDRVQLNSENVSKYRNSKNLLVTEQAYTTRLTFNSDYEALKNRENLVGENVNKTILSYPDFRKAISYSILRTEFCEECAPLGVAAYGLFSSYYCSDFTDGKIYRMTDNAINYQKMLYDTDDENSINGYDVKYASELFESAYLSALSNGDITENDKVELEFLVYNSDDAYKKIVSYIQSAINKACVGTSLENRIEIKTKVDSDFYSSARVGQFEIIISAMKGAYDNIYSLMKSFCVPDVMYEYGFTPTITALIVNINGEDTTKTFYDWYIALTEGEYSNSDVNTKIKLFAALEKGILESYCTVPLYYFANYSLYSIKAVPATSQYIQNIGYGGFKHITYDYSDSQWSDYCKTNVNI